MRPTIYIETTIIGYLAMRVSSLLRMAASQVTTRDWWENHRHRFDLFVSRFVVDECSGGDPLAARERLAYLNGIPLLEISNEVNTLAISLRANRWTRLGCSSPAVTPGSPGLLPRMAPQRRLFLPDDFFSRNPRLTEPSFRNRPPALCWCSPLWPFSGANAAQRHRLRLVAPTAELLSCSRARKCWPAFLLPLLPRRLCPARMDSLAMADAADPHDPFREARTRDGMLLCPFQGENLPMILRHAGVRDAAKDWKTFSSDAPFRVPIPSEEEVRTMRQLPIETNPPEHTEYRAIVEPFFQRAKQPDVIAKIECLIDEMLSKAMARESIEIVHDFALPIQSRALTYLLNVPESEATVWVSWGIHVFKVTGGEFKKGTVLEDYLNAQFDRAAADPGEDFFSALVKARFRGRALTREEMMGFGNLTFAGGRDTIIHSISSIIAYLGRNPAALEFLREDPKRIVHAGEEFFRVFMPLTHIGRVCPVETDVYGVKVPPGGRVSLTWPAANFDETVFDAPHEIRLDRRPNPHLSFGFGPHLCLGAPHARLIVRSLLQALVERASQIAVLDSRQHVEREPRYERANGYDSLTVAFKPCP